MKPGDPSRALGGESGLADGDTGEDMGGWEATYGSRRGDGGGWIVKLVCNVAPGCTSRRCGMPPSEPCGAEQLASRMVADGVVGLAFAEPGCKRRRGVPADGGLGSRLGEAVLGLTGDESACGISCKRRGPLPLAVSADCRPRASLFASRPLAPATRQFLHLFDGTRVASGTAVSCTGKR